MVAQDRAVLTRAARLDHPRHGQQKSFIAQTENARSGMAAPCSAGCWHVSMGRRIPTPGSIAGLRMVHGPPISHSPSVAMMQRGQRQFNIYCAPCMGWAVMATGMIAVHADSSWKHVDASGEYA